MELDEGVRGDIADDEVRHAELSWAIDAFLCAQLGPAERALVERARARALRDLIAEAWEPVDADLARLAGLPAPAVAADIVAGLAAARLAA